jgi:hypothetical protein
MRERDGANIVQKSASLKARLRGSGFRVIIAGSKFGAPLKILRGQRVRNFFVRLRVIVLGRMKIRVVEKMPRTGWRVTASIGVY